MGLPDSHRVSRAPRYLGTKPQEPYPFRLRNCYPLRWTFPCPSTRDKVCNSLVHPYMCLVSPHYTACTTRTGFNVQTGLGSFRFARHYSGNRRYLSLPRGTKMFQFPRLASAAYVFSHRWFRITGTGFPHSEISGSTLARSYPELIAVCRVLHRLSVPRHPPHALSSLTENIPQK